MNLGAPMHVLLLHVVVVLGPLLALGLILYAWWPHRFRWLEAPLAVVGLVVGVMGPLTGHFGEELAKSVDRTELVKTHEQWGGLAEKICLAMLVMVLMQLLAHGGDLARRLPVVGKRTFEQNAGLRTLVSVASTIVAALCIILVFLAGHSGAVSVWSS